jgi:hypothetical protein
MNNYGEGLFLRSWWLCRQLWASYIQCTSCVFDSFQSYPPHLHLLFPSCLSLSLSLSLSLVCFVSNFIRNVDFPIRTTCLLLIFRDFVVQYCLMKFNDNKAAHNLNFFPWRCWVSTAENSGSVGFVPGRFSKWSHWEVEGVNVVSSCSLYAGWK